MALGLVAACAGTAADSDSERDAAPPPAGSEASPGTSVASDPPPADHHAHIRSPDATEAVLEIQEAIGQTIWEDDVGPTGAAELLAALDSAGIRRASVLSVGYFFEMPDVDFPEARARLQAENDYVAREVARAPERLLGFCAVNPLTAYASEEVERCGRELGLEGVKLHLANSGVELRDSAHVAALREVFRTANRLGMPLVVHLRTRNEDYGRRDAEIFLRRVLSAAPDVPVQVAHLAGWSGMDAATDSAVQAFVDAIEAEPEAWEGRLYFDLAATAVPPERVRGDSAALAQARAINGRVGERVVDLGPDRVLFGTDWDAMSLPAYAGAMPEALPLEPEVLRDVLDDEAPWMGADRDGPGPPRGEPR